MKVLILSLFLACASAQFFPYGPGPFYGNNYFGGLGNSFGPDPYGNAYGRFGPGFPGPYGGPAGYPVGGPAGYPFGGAGFPYGGPVNQYKMQDPFGQVASGYSYPGQAAQNFVDAAGNQVGSYSYFDPNNKQVQVSYTADSNGFRVLSNNLPVGPQDTPEVAAAKAQLALAKLSRGKRQIVDITPRNQFLDDLLARSVDLNQDGFPDVPLVPAPVVPVAPVVPALPAPGAVLLRGKRQVVDITPRNQFLDDLLARSVDLNNDGFPDMPLAPAAPVVPYAGLPAPYAGLPLPYSGLPAYPFTGLPNYPFAGLPNYPLLG